MSRKIKLKSLLTLFLLLLIRTTSGCYATGLGYKDPYNLVTIVSNKESTGTEAEVSLEELRLIFTLKLKYWRNGDEIKLVIMKQCYCNQYFIKDILEYNIDDYIRGIAFAVKNGARDNIIIVNTASELLEKVSKTPGAVGIVYTSSVLSSAESNYGTVALK